MKNRFVAFVLSAVMSCLLLTGCSGGGSSSGTIPIYTGTGNGGKITTTVLGASWARDQDYTWLYYSAESTNTNSETASQCEIIVTAKSKDGGFLCIDKTGLTGDIAAGDTIRYSGVVRYQGKEPAKVEVSLRPLTGYSDRYYKAVRASEFQVSNKAFTSDKKKLTGTVINNGSMEAERVRISVLFKKGGKHIGGYCGYAADVQPNGGRADFEITIPSYFQKPDAFDSYEVAVSMA